MLSRVQQVAVRAEAAADELREVEILLAQSPEKLEVVERRLSHIAERLARTTSLVRQAAQQAREGLRTTDAAEDMFPPPTAAAEPPVPRLTPLEPLAPRPSLRERLEEKGLLGARGLALVGAGVTILGLVLLVGFSGGGGGGDFLGPGAVTAIGAGLSALAVLVGLLLRRRFGESHAAVAMTGVGIAGGYATLLGVGALYDLVPQWLGLIVASLLAALGAALAINWRSQTVAILGLVGAIVVPGLASIGAGPTILGTSYVEVVLAATLALAARERWTWLLVSAVVTSGVQILWLAVSPPTGRSAGAMALACVFGATYLAVGIARQQAGRREALDSLASLLITWPAALVGWSGARLLGGELFGVDSLGILLLGTAVAYAVLAGAFYGREHGRHVSVLLGAVAFTLGAIGTAQILGGATLAVVWALEAAVLAWLALRVDEPRFQLAALAYLVLAVVHALAFEAPPRRLYEAIQNPGSKLWAVAATALLAAAVGMAARRWAPLEQADWGLKLPPRAHEALGGGMSYGRRAALAPAAVLALYAVSLAILQIAYSSRIGSFIDRFAWGHAVDSVLWACVGLGLVAAGRRSGLRLAGFVLLGLALVDVCTYQQSQLSVQVWGTSSLLVAAAFGAAGVVDGLRSRRDPGGPALATLLVAGGLATAAVVRLADTRHTQGLALLGVGIVAAALAAWVLPRRRNLAAVLWLEALGLVSAAVPLVLHDIGLVAVYAALAVVTGSLAAPAREPRLRLAAYGPLLAAAAVTFATLAQPRELFVETHQLWRGLFALLLLILGLAVLVVLERQPVVAPQPDSFDHKLAAVQDRVELAATWALAVLVVYAASLGILQVAQSVGGRTAERSFETGRTAVTGALAVLGAALVIHGGSLRRLQLRVLGFALLACAAVDAVAFEAAKLPRNDWVTATMLLALACGVAGVVDGLRSKRDPEPAAAVALLVAGGLAAAALTVRIVAERTQALSLVGLSLVAAALAAGLLPRRRNLATVAWLEGLALVLAALPMLLHGSGLVAALAVLSVGLAALAPALREPRLQLAALVPLVVGAGVTFVTLATPRELFVETHRLWQGLLALVLVLGALACLLALFRPIERPDHDRVDEAVVAFRPRFALVAVWTLALLALYTASIAVLQVVTWSGASFQSGQSAVSAVWSLIAVGALTVGLVRDLPIVRLTGFAMIGVTLAKIFLYDLASLSATARALSFLAVGAVLLVSGFFYQRLTARQTAEEAAAGAPSSPVPR